MDEPGFFFGVAVIKRAIEKNLEYLAISCHKIKKIPVFMPLDDSDGAPAVGGAVAPDPDPGVSPSTSWLTIHFRFLGLL